MFSTVKIKCTLPNDKNSTGTCFFYCIDHASAIVTNRHVIENSLTGEFSLTQGENNEPVLSRGIKIKFDKFFEKWLLHPDPKVDLAMMPLKPVVTECRRKGKLPFYTRIQSDTIPDVAEWKDFIPIEDILMVGYPYGLWDETNNLPFFMKGITSTHPGIDYRGNNEFVINMPVYRGSSGSPVFLVNKGFYDKSRSYQNGRDYVTSRYSLQTPSLSSRRKSKI
jgi:Trypsin-like peptidase domain